MTITIPPEVEKSILDAVRNGRFRSAEEAVATAWLEWDRKQAEPPATQADEPEANPDPLMGLWQDYADEMDQIVVDAYHRRREEPWRESEP